MKQLVILQGEPGCGKTTFIKRLGLDSYTISPDEIRLQMSQPQWKVGDINIGVSQNNDKKVWKMLFEVLEFRMSNGDFTIIDATHTSEKQIKAYKQLSDHYGYRTYLVNLGNGDVEKSIENNHKREDLDKVTDEVIYKMHERLKNIKIPKYVNVVNKDTFIYDISWKTLDLNDYFSVNIVGDIHGCFSALQDSGVFEYKNIINNPDSFYIFLGDYFDRGIENKQMFEYLMAIKDLPNVILLEGNHEKYLRLYGDSTIDESKDNKKELKSYYRSNSFISTTLQEFIEYGISKKDARALARKLQQAVVFEFGGNTHVCTHGGILPEMVGVLNLVSTNQLIKGVGGYDTDIDRIWDETNFGEYIQFHGHRNNHKKTNENTYSYNLEQSVEKGGTLSTVTIWKFGDKVKYDTKETPNEIYSNEHKINALSKDEYNKVTTVKEFFEQSLEDKNIKVVHQYDNVYSVNFTKAAFRKHNWNNLTTLARGLFINYDGKDSYIIGRGYEKFFNLYEQDNTEEKLKEKLSPVVTLYKKENGFLGLIYYDDKLDKLVYCSKSMTDIAGGEHALLFKDLMETKYKDSIPRLKNMFKNEHKNQTMLFEVIDPINDPHIIDEKEPKVVLLDIVENTMEGKKLGYDVDILSTSFLLNIPAKKIIRQIALEYLFKEDYSDYIRYEGYVIEDNKGNMLKYKSKYYNDWKLARSVVGKIFKNKEVELERLEGETLDFVKWVKDNKEDLEEYKNNIIKLREIYYENTKL